MMRYSAAIMVLLLLAGHWRDVRAQSPLPDLPTATVTFHSIADRARAGSIELANGVKVDAKDWRTLFITEVGQQRLSNGKTSLVTCTATVVGSGVLLTAAHCLDAGPGFPFRAGIVLALGGQRIAAICEAAMEYGQAVDKQVWNGGIPRVAADYALCRFDMPRPVPTALDSLFYENVEASEGLASGSPILMMGFGCAEVYIDQSRRLQTRAFDDILRVGNAVISTTNHAGGDFPSSFVAIWSEVGKQPALCPGDSGGPLWSGVTASAQSGPRRLRGINSWITVRSDASGAARVISMVAPVAVDEFRQFAHKWLAENPDKSICGISVNAGAGQCHE